MGKKRYLQKLIGLAAAAALMLPLPAPAAISGDPAGGILVETAEDVQVPEETTAEEHVTDQLSAVKGVKVSNAKEQALAVSWKAVSGAKGYRVKYSASPGMQKAVSRSTKETSLELTGLTVHRRYYITVEAWMKEDGQKWYSLPSAVRSRKVTGTLICIDPGHQRHANTEQEPVGPGASATKKKVSAGTAGKWSKLNESELNLQVSLQLRDELEKRGYQVLMTRTVQDVNISNIERAQIANEANADVMIRIHANSSGNSSRRGASTICCTAKNVYYGGKTYRKSRRLADLVLENFRKATGSRVKKVWETDTMTGLNWSKVPAIILEMGYMSNRTEDLLMAKASYQKKIVRGIANGLDEYFGKTTSAKAK